MVDFKKNLIPVVCVGVMVISFAIASAFAGQERSNRLDTPLETLRQIGSTAAKAVLNKDVSTLLHYDRADLRKDDEVFLRNRQSGLYCFLFNSECIPGGKARSVYDVLSTAHNLTIKVIDGGKSKKDGNRYAMILFFDRSTVSNRSLRSQKFLCSESLTRIASWSFKLVEGRWEPVTPLFDNETDTLCSQD